MTAFYPVFLDLRGRRAVVIGGGSVAEGKVRGLVAAGAHVTVVSPAVTPALGALVRRNAIELKRRPYRRGDLAGAWLVIAAVNRSVSEAVWAEAEQLGVPLNAVDDIEHCSFIAPAVHREGDITVAVSTAGKSPALAVRLRQRIARLVGRAEARLCELLGELRPELAEQVPDARARTALWYAIVDSDVIDFVRRGDIEGARGRIDKLVREHELGIPRLKPGPSATLPLRAVPNRAHSSEWESERGVGTVYLVGAGPGDPGLITAKGLELLRSADVVVYDRLVSPALLAQAPAEAERILRAADQQDVNALLIDRARDGRNVVRLKGGDPFVFGRGAEECEALRAAGVPYEVIPGVTSATAVPAAAGIPVTHRRVASGFAVVAGHECDGQSDLDWEALSRMPTLVVLMGLAALPDVVARLRAQGAPADTPVAVIASGTLPEQRSVLGTLDDIAELVAGAALEPPATVVIGEVVRVGLTQGPARLVSHA
jgi:uroporphyrin-III C-methyltransferase / precorrin-2 dehydrogenase / sirohydrochlorin ferrochelatase